MADTNICVVEGFNAGVFSCNQKGLKVVLKADKEDIKSGTYDLGSVLKSLEIHNVAGETAPISVSLLNTATANTTSSFEFVVTSFVVKPEEIKVTIELNEEDFNDADLLGNITKSLAFHIAQEKAIEMVLAGVA